MRTPEQRVIHQEGIYNVAKAAFDRAEQGVHKAETKKASAIQYAKNNVGHAGRAVEAVERKIATFQKELEQLKTRLTQAESEAVTYDTRYDASIAVCVSVRTDMKRKLDAATALWVEASNHVEHLEREAHKETMKRVAEMKNEKSPEQRERQRKIAFEGGTASMNDKLNNE